MTAWPKVRLAKILTPVSRPETLLPNVQYRLLGAHWYAEGLYLKDVKAGSEIQAKQLCRVKAGDFVYNRLFAWKGSFALAGTDVDGCYVSNEFPCFLVNADRADGRYLWHYFSRESVWFEALGLSSGGTPTSRNRLKEERLLAMSIPLPPVEDQRRISDILDSNSKKLIDIALLSEAIDRQLDGLVVALHKASADGRIQDMGGLVELSEEQVSVERTGEYPQVGVRGFGKGLFQRETIAGTGTTYRYFNRLYSGCLVLSQVKGWEGAVAVCPPELAGFFVSPEYRTFKCREEAIIPEYLAVLVQNPWFWTKLASITRGVGARRERTRPERFLEIKIEMPTPDRQKDILSALTRIREAAAIRTHATNELKAVLPAMISHMLTAGVGIDLSRADLK